MGAVKEAEVEPKEGISKEVSPKVPKGISTEEEITLIAKGGVRGEEVLSYQVPRIESLLGDIYEL